jgi:hypothetical protein
MPPKRSIFSNLSIVFHFPLKRSHERLRCLMTDEVAVGRRRVSKFVRNFPCQALKISKVSLVVMGLWGLAASKAYLVFFSYIS